MKQVLSTTTVKIPKDVKLTLNGRTVTVTGKRGTLTQNFGHLQVAMRLLGKRTMQIDLWFGNRKQLATVRTLQSHIRNMIQGVQTGFQYRMRFAYAHFPINTVILEKNGTVTVEIRNFLGERRARKVTMLPGVTVEKNEEIKDCLDLFGNDINMVSRSAALIHQSTMARNKDIRKFLDGIYVAEKGPIGAMQAI